MFEFLYKSYIDVILELSAYSDFKFPQKLQSCYLFSYKTEASVSKLASINLINNKLHLLQSSNVHSLSNETNVILLFFPKPPLSDIKS